MPDIGLLWGGVGSGEFKGRFPEEVVFKLGKQSC